MCLCLTRILSPCLRVRKMRPARRVVPCSKIENKEVSFAFSSAAVSGDAFKRPALKVWNLIMKRILMALVSTGILTRVTHALPF